VHPVIEKYLRLFAIPSIALLIIISPCQGQVQPKAVDTLWQPKVEISFGLYSPSLRAFKKEDRGNSQQYVISIKRELDKNWSLGGGVAYGHDVSTTRSGVRFEGIIVDFSGERAILQNKWLRFYGAGYLVYHHLTQHEYNIPNSSLIIQERFSELNAFGIGLGLGGQIRFPKLFFIATEFAYAAHYGKWTSKDLLGCNCITYSNYGNGFVAPRVFSIMIGIRL
jgi:hypothetical protein